MDERALLTSLRTSMLLAFVVFGKDDRFRAPFVMMINALEDALGIERTCSTRAERRAKWAHEHPEMQQNG